MSDIIRLLPDHIANQIAAGEVVQRPASVVKELIENSIDAGATKIELLVKEAGRTSIHIIDNGKGMSFTDARMAFERHATSKIQHADDLFNLRTKGFRGEALASIGAVAHVHLKTKREIDDLGTHLLMEGSLVVQHETQPAAQGSSFEVKNLFFNVPARRNFLKSDQVEFKHICDEFERVALAHPALHFRLVHNGQEIYHLEPGTLRKRIIGIFGKAYNEQLVPISEQTDIVKIEGFIGKPEAARKSRGEQFLFVNNRFFKDTYFNHAITQAYDNLLAPRTYPSYFLFFEIDPKAIDVNVHPTKTEIKFEEDKAIYSILKSTIRSGLGRFNIMPTLDFERESSFDIPASMFGQPAVEPTIKVDPSYNPFTTTTSRSSSSGSSNSGGNSAGLNQFGFGSSTSANNWDTFFNEVKAEEEVQLEQTSLAIEKQQIVGPFIVRNGFIFFSSESGLGIIHARRAQERLIYEEMMRGFMINPLASQQLLFPLDKNFSTHDIRVWNDNAKTLERIGFNWEFQDQTFLLHGMPAVLDESTVISLIDKLLELFQVENIDKGEIAHTVLSQLSFAASMSFKVPTEQTLVQSFIDQLMELDEHQFTPNGKRIIQAIDQGSILQLF